MDTRRVATVENIQMLKIFVVQASLRDANLRLFDPWAEAHGYQHIATPWRFFLMRGCLSW
jgi:hypothetical protein